MKPAEPSSVYENSKVPSHSLPSHGSAFDAIREFTEVLRMGSEHFSWKTSSEMIAEMKSLRPCYLGDYYPLLPISLEESAWCGWQYDRADLGEGFAMLFRSDKAAPFMTGQFPLRGLDSAADYEITRVDSGERAVMSGASLLDGLEVTIAERPGSALIRYQKRTSEE